MLVFGLGFYLFVCFKRGSTASLKELQPGEWQECEGNVH